MTTGTTTTAGLVPVRVGLVPARCGPRTKRPPLWVDPMSPTLEQTIDGAFPYGYRIVSYQGTHDINPNNTPFLTPTEMTELAKGITNHGNSYEQWHISIKDNYWDHPNTHNKPYNQLYLGTVGITTILKQLGLPANTKPTHTTYNRYKQQHPTPHNKYTTTAPHNHTPTQTKGRQ